MGFGDLLCCPTLYAGAYRLERKEGEKCNTYHNVAENIKLYYSTQGIYIHIFPYIGNAKSKMPIW